MQVMAVQRQPCARTRVASAVQADALVDTAMAERAVLVLSGAQVAQVAPAAWADFFQGMAALAATAVRVRLVPQELRVLRALAQMEAMAQLQAPAGTVAQVA